LRLPFSETCLYTMSGVATTDGYVNAEIRPQVSGYTIRQDYKEGAVVSKGQVLFEIDPRPFLFLQDWRATLIPMLAVPVSLVGTFVLFPIFGFSINTLSLFGLVLAIGLVVDDAIVVVEGIQRHIEEGLAPKDAARKAMEELTGPVVGIALVLAAVFVPTVFIPGITGRLY
jgi:hypothetical protein